MSCNCHNSCCCTENESFRDVYNRESKRHIIHQLTKRTDTGEEYEIYPNTVIQAVHDLKTGQGLDILLSKTNHIHLPFMGSRDETLVQVPREQRRKGLVVTFTNCSDNTKHIEYIGCSTSDSEWTKRCNWVPFPQISEETEEEFLRKFKKIDTNTIPTNLKIQEGELILELENKDGDKLPSLRTPLNTEDRWYKPCLKLEDNTLIFTVKNEKDEVVTRKELDLSSIKARPTTTGFTTEVRERRPSPTDPSVKEGVIYVVPNPDAPGTAREYILLDIMGKKHIEQLGSASGVCAIGNNNQDEPLIDKHLKGGTYADGVITLTVGNGEEPNEKDKQITIDLSELSGSINDEELNKLKERLDALEAKKDNDTIFDPTSINDRLTALENKEDKDTVFNPQALEERLTALESKEDKDTLYDDSELKNNLNSLTERVTTLEGKEDNDTIYDDSEVKRRITELEKRPIGNNITPYDDTEVKRRLTTLEEKQDKDTIYDDSDITRRLTALEGKADKDTVYNDTEIKGSISTLQEEVNELKNRKDKFASKLEVLEGSSENTKKIKLTVTNGEPLEAEIPVGSTQNTNVAGAVIFLTQEEYNNLMNNSQLQSDKLYVITN